MSRAVNQSGVNRREFMSYAMALGGMTAAASVVGPASAWGAVNHKPLDPINPDILFGSTSSLWGGQLDIEWAIKRIAALGLQGIEQERPLERHAAACTHGLDGVELAVRERACIVNKSADQRRLAVIDVTGNDHAQQRVRCTPG